MFLRLILSEETIANLLRTIHMDIYIDVEAMAVRNQRLKFFVRKVLTLNSSVHRIDWKLKKVSRPITLDPQEKEM